MAIDSTLPPYLAQRAAHWSDQTVSRDIQVGAQLVQQAQQERRLQKAFELKERAENLALQEKERQAQGVVEVMGVFSKLGDTGNYDDPALQREFYDAVRRNPEFADTPAFTRMMQMIDNSEKLQVRKELLSTTYDLRGKELESKHLQRLDELDLKLANALQVAGINQQGREAIQQLRNTNNLEREQLRVKAGTALEDQRQTGRMELQENRHLQRLDELDKQFENLLKRDDLRQDDRLALEAAQQKNRLERDQLRPKTLRPERFDLDESARMGMSADLKAAEVWYRDRLANTFDPVKREAIETEYKQRREAIDAKYAPMRKTPSVQPPAPASPAAPTNPNDPFGIFQ